MMKCGTENQQRAGFRCSSLHILSNNFEVWDQLSFTAINLTARVHACRYQKNTKRLYSLIDHQDCLSAPVHKRNSKRKGISIQARLSLPLRQTQEQGDLGEMALKRNAKTDSSFHAQSCGNFSENFPFPFLYPSVVMLLYK